MKPITFFLNACAIILVSSCSPKHPHKSTKETIHTEVISKAATDEKNQGVLTNSQEETLKKAKAAEKLLEEANEKRLNDIDEITK